jgi:hypothetical protein
MALEARPKTVEKPSRKEAEVISRAPDAKPKAARQKPPRINKVQITVPIHPDLLARLDQHARRRYESRAGLIARAIVELVEREGGQG